MKRKVCLFFLLTIGLCVLTSCQSFYDFTRVDAQPVSDFLPNKELLQKSNSKYPFHFVYLDPKAPAYKKIYIAPVDISSLEKDKNLRDFIGNSNGVFQKQLDELTTYIRNTNIDKFKNFGDSKWFTVVDSPKTPDSFSLELSISQITPAKGGWNIIGVASDITLGVGSIITSQFAYGSLTIEGRVRDNNTGKIVAMFATTERDEDTVLGNYANFTWLSSAKTNAKNIAIYTAEIFNADSYYDVKHNFPIQWISF